MSEEPLETPPEKRDNAPEKANDSQGWRAIGIVTLVVLFAGLIVLVALLVPGDSSEGEPVPGETPQTNLEDHHWVLTTYSGNGVLAGTQVTADFKDGQVTGSAGCNSYFAPYERTATELQVGASGSTLMNCNQPAGIMEQEAAYLSLLQSSATYQISEGQLAIHDSSGNRLLANNAAVSGIVTYRERIALPDDAVVVVQLQDISLADAPAVILGEQAITTAGQQAPFPYTVAYDPTAILENHSYSMSARITDGAGNLLFISDTIVPVITRGNPSTNVEIMTVRVGG